MPGADLLYKELHKIRTDSLGKANVDKQKFERANFTSDQLVCVINVVRVNEGSELKEVLNKVSPKQVDLSVFPTTKCLQVMRVLLWSALDLALRTTSPGLCFTQKISFKVMFRKHLPGLALQQAVSFVLFSSKKYF